MRFLKNTIENIENYLPDSDKINSCLLKNNENEIKSALEFLKNDEKFLYIHGFLGTGKRQFINYICEFLENDVIRLEYFCKESTVCDDILLNFLEIIKQSSDIKTVSINSKITLLSTKFINQISTIKKPIFIILHTLDNIAEHNIKAVTAVLNNALKENNVKLIITTKGLQPSIINEREEDRNIFLKAFSKEIFNEYLTTNNIEYSDRQSEDLYNITRGYYFYTAISVKIIQLLQISVGEFVRKIQESGMTFDSFIGYEYLNLIPQAIRNFFWFLRSLRHGISINALAVIDIYDETSIEYLRNNLVIFISNETIYLHDYFAQQVDIIIPDKTAIRLHKYIIKIYEEQLKEPIETRAILISRQALRAEIEYHGQIISQIESGDFNKNDAIEELQQEQPPKDTFTQLQANDKEQPSDTSADIQQIKTLTLEKKYTEAIELCLKLLENNEIGLTTLVDIRLKLAKLYKACGEYSLSSKYYELVAEYYKHHNENINLNYLYYDLTDVYHLQYKNERAIETIKKVIYSVDTPQSLLVSACTLLGNIYSSINNPKDAYSYYKKALDSLNENVDSETLAELYFKFALSNDEKDDIKTALEYYDKCIGIGEPNLYKASAYSNIAACYYEMGNSSEALKNYLIAYDIEKNNNNYDAIYYNSSKIAQIYIEEGSDEALKFLIEAEQCADFLDEPFYMITSSIAIGDYYYNIPEKMKDSLIKYFKAKKIAERTYDEENIKNINRRIKDMQIRLGKNKFEEIQKRYDK